MTMVPVPLARGTTDPEGYHTLPCMLPPGAADRDLATST